MLEEGQCTARLLPPPKKPRSGAAVSWRLGWGKRPSHPASPGAAHGILPTGRRHARAHATAAQSLPAAAPAPPRHRDPATREASGLAPPGTTARARLGSMREAASPPLPRCRDSVLFLSGACRVLAERGGNLRGKWPWPPAPPAPGAPGPRATADPSSGEARSGSTGAWAAFFKRNPWIPCSICKSCQKLGHSTGTAGCLFLATVPLAAASGYHFGEVPQHLAAPRWKGTEAQLFSSSRGPSAIDFYPFSPAVVYKVGLA